MAKEQIAKAPSGRPNRQPVGLRQRQKLDVQCDPNFVQRWVVDYDGTGDRIAAFKAGGYELVESKVATVGDSRVDQATPEGSVEQRNAGNGQKQYLMQIPKELYDADQKAKQAIVDKSEDALKKPALDGTYGNIDIQTKDSM